MAKYLYLANTDWYFYNFRLPLAREAIAQGHEVLVVTPPGPYVAAMTAAGCRCVAIPFSRFGTHPLREARTLWALFRLLRTERPDVLHSFTLKCVLYGTLVGRLAGIARIVNSVTGTGYLLKDTGRMTCWVRLLFIGLGKVCFSRRGIVFIFQNRVDLQAFIDRGLVRPSAAELIRGSGVDISQFLPAAQPPAGPALVLLTARMLWGKGIGDFVAAAQLLRQQGVTARFVLVGGTDPEDGGSIPLTQLQEWVMSGVVEWWGAWNDMPAVFTQSTIVCLPTYYGEGVPKSLIEAAACGLPIVASNEPGCREIVIDADDDPENGTGLLVPAKNPELLASAIFRLIRDSNWAKKLGERGREKVCKEFYVQMINAKTFRLYERAESVHSCAGRLF